MRAILKTLWLVAALAVGCKTYHAGDGTAVPLGDDASYAPPAGRQVITEGGLVGTLPDGGIDGRIGGGAGGFGVGSSPDDARADQSSTYDAPWYPEAGGGGACVACDLIQQNCPGAAQGCYPGATTGCCDLTDEVPEGSGCVEDSQCAPGLICIDLVCVKLCDTTAPSCGPACKSIGRFPNIGYCAP